MSNTPELPELVEFIAETIVEKKGYDIVIIDLREKSDITDYYIIASVDSDAQMKAVDRWVETELRDHGFRLRGKDGKDASDWMILDYNEVIVHLFKPEARQRFDIESMWKDVPIIHFTDPKEPHQSEFV